MLTLEKAKTVAHAALAKASELGIKITVAVVDEHGVLILLKRTDGALVVSPKFATSKAYTAAVVGLPTEEIAKYSGDGKPLYGLPSAFGGELMLIPGGIPIKEGEVTVGAVGVGGSYDVSQDVACASAGVSAMS